MLYFKVIIFSLTAALVAKIMFYVHMAFTVHRAFLYVISFTSYSHPVIWQGIALTVLYVMKLKLHKDKLLAQGSIASNYKN